MWCTDCVHHVEGPWRPNLNPESRAFFWDSNLNPESRPVSNLNPESWVLLGWIFPPKLVNQSWILKSARFEIWISNPWPEIGFEIWIWDPHFKGPMLVHKHVQSVIRESSEWLRWVDNHILASYHFFPRIRAVRMVWRHCDSSHRAMYDYTVSQYSRHEHHLTIVCQLSKAGSAGSCHFYRPRSEGDNVLVSVRPSVRLFVCALPAEPFDIKGNKVQ